MNGGTGRKKGSALCTSEGDVGEAVRAADVDGIGEDPEERLGDEREAPGVLHELQAGGAEPQAAREVEVERQPREAAEALHPVAEAAHPPHPAHLPQRPAPLGRGRQTRGRGRWRWRRRLEGRRGGGVLELGQPAPPPPLLRRRRHPEA